MLKRERYNRNSIDTNLFFARIMKEHAYFLEAGFTKMGQELARDARNFQYDYLYILRKAIDLSNGFISEGVIDSEELVTDFTLDAELKTQYYTGLPINTDVTEEELALTSDSIYVEIYLLSERLSTLNQEAMAFTMDFIKYQADVLNKVNDCRVYTSNYPLLIEHMLREAKYYLDTLLKLESGQNIISDETILKAEVFWNNIMAEHAKFVRGYLDPTEEERIALSNDTAILFDQLTGDAKDTLDVEGDSDEVTEASLEATEDIKDFKTKGVDGLINCNIKSLILPLVGDHVLREANFYLRNLEIYQELDDIIGE